MKAREIMTVDVVTASIDATLEGVVERMLDRGVGSVIISADGTPAGMITETDVLRAAYRTGKPFAEIPVEDVMTRPVKTIEANTNVSRVAARMNEHGVKKLPVMDGIELVGVITLTDIVHHFSEHVDAGSDRPFASSPDDDHFSEPI